MISVVLCMLSCALVGYAENATDSVAAAITVYRNPEFFTRLNRNREKLEPMDEDKEDIFNNDGFYGEVRWQSLSYLCELMIYLRFSAA